MDKNDTTPDPTSRIKELEIQDPALLDTATEMLRTIQDVTGKTSSQILRSLLHKDPEVLSLLNQSH